MQEIKEKQKNKIYISVESATIGVLIAAIVIGSVLLFAGFISQSELANSNTGSSVIVK